MITLIVWGVAMVAALASAITAGYLSYQAAGRQVATQMATEKKLAHKQVNHYELKAETGSFTTTGSTAALLVKEGEQVDAAKAEEPDR